MPELVYGFSVSRPVLSDVGYVPGVGSLLGFARVSMAEQNAALQVDELTAAGCFRVYTDQASGVLDRRPELDAVLGRFRPGDTLVLWRLDRLGRPLRHLIGTVTSLVSGRWGSGRCGRASTPPPPGGRLVFHLFGALAQFEREIIRDRTVAGLAADRARGRTGGRPSKLNLDQVKTARRLYDERELTVVEISRILGVSRTSIYRALGRDRPPSAAGAKAAAGREGSG